VSLTRDAVHRPLREAAAKSDWKHSPIRVKVLCGVGTCHKRLGTVRATTVGMVWVPEAVPYDLDGPDRTFGHYPVLLSVGDPAARDGLCESISVDCFSHRALPLTTTVVELVASTPQNQKSKPSVVLVRYTIGAR
jgi:hypothetical protein